jgi:hypothetical protein
MVKIYYYYDPILKSEDGRYTVDYYCSDSKHKVWVGCHCGESPRDVLKFVRELVDRLNRTQTLFGSNSWICRWFRFMRRI